MNIYSDMNVYNYDRDTGYYLGISQADPDPLNEGGWLIPAYAVTVAPPLFLVGKIPQWDGSKWVVVDLPAPPQPPEPPAPYQPTSEEQRLAAYRNESDPLFFKWQRGEGTQEAWLAKIEEIKARYP